MKNYMKDIAKLLGVEIGEEFIIKNAKRRVMWDTGKKELVDVYPLDYIVAKFDKNGNVRDNILTGLLTGVYVIERKPWKPKYKDTYWSIGTGGVLEPGTWLNDFVDISLYRLGNCYRTAEEASANADKWIAFCESDETIKC